MKRHLACVGLLWLLVWNGAHAEPSDGYRQHVAGLDSDDYAQRVDATEALLRDPELTPQRVAELVPLDASPEQRHRLRLVARHHLLRQLRQERFGDAGPGSIGVVQTILSTGDGGGPWGPDGFPGGHPGAGDDPGGGAGVPGVPPLDRPRLLPNPLRQGPGEGGYVYALVSRVLPGFPAAGWLRPMDRIVALDGQPLGQAPDARRFELMMRRYTAGQPLTLTVLRDGQRLDITLTLANGAALPAMFGQADFALTPTFVQAWRDYRERVFGPAGQVTGGPAAP